MEKYTISSDELKGLFMSIALAEQEAKANLAALDRVLLLHKLSTALSNKALEIVQRIKERYPYIWNECTDEKDYAYVTDLMKKLQESN